MQTVCRPPATLACMGWAIKKNSGKWQGLYRNSEGKLRSAGMYLRESDAKAAANRKEALERLDPEITSEVTLQEWFDTWFPKRRVTRRTQQEDQKRFNLRILPKFGKKALSDITKKDVEGWIEEMEAEDLAASTIVKHVHNLSAAMKAAKDEKMIQDNPCYRVALPKKDPTPDRYLTREEVDAVRGFLSGMNLLIFEILIGTGARWGEGVALHWDHIDFDNHTIKLLFSWDRHSKVFAYMKHYSQRTVPMSPRLEAILLDHLKTVGYGKATAHKYEPKSLKPKYGVVLAGPSGDPVAPTTFAHAISAAGKAAEVVTNGIPRRVGHFRPHDLRHTYASWLVQDSIPLGAVSDLLGHSSITVTERYARFGDKSWDAVRATLDK